MQFRQEYKKRAINQKDSHGVAMRGSASVQRAALGPPQSLLQPFGPHFFFFIWIIMVFIMIIFFQLSLGRGLFFFCLVCWCIAPPPPSHFGLIGDLAMGGGHAMPHYLCLVPKDAPGKGGDDAEWIGCGGSWMRLQPWVVLAHCGHCANQGSHAGVAWLASDGQHGVQSGEAKVATFILLVHLPLLPLPFVLVGHVGCGGRGICWMLTYPVHILLLPPMPFIWFSFSSFFFPNLSSVVCVWAKLSLACASVGVQSSIAAHFHCPLLHRFAEG